MVNKVKNIHFVGIGGSGISGVASLASKMGYSVSGCDIEASTAYMNNIFQGHSPEHIKDADLVVVSPSLFYSNRDNKEIKEAKRRKILITWEEFLAEYLQTGKKVICVAGTHGKSTTTAMAGKLLIDAGFDPSVVIGATVPEWKENSKYGHGGYFVAEADEFNDNFLYYSPEIIILNNIEFDHPDYFENEGQVFRSFKKFVEKLKGDKVLITDTKMTGISKLIEMLGKKVNLIDIAELDVELNLKVPGKHNIENAKGVYALGIYLGIKSNEIIKSLENFAGIGRRLELIANKNGIKVYDDYAHHPTAIEATLEGLRNPDLEGKMWVVVEPHGFNRTKALLSKYKTAFHEADRVLIGPIFPARDKETFGMTPQIIASKSANAVGFNSFDEIKRILKRAVKPGDIIVVMGAGKSYLWARKIVKII